MVSTPRYMRNTKEEILSLLKRNGGHSVNELATSLKLAPITIRQHLTKLDRDGLLVTENGLQTNGGPHSSGRPHYIFRLTAKAHAQAFPYRSDRLVELLVREIGHLVGSDLEGLSSKDKTFLGLDRLAQRLAEEYESLLQGWPLQERIVFVTEVMRADGGFAEWEQTERGYEISDFNCLFHRLLAGDSCEWHGSFLSHMLGSDVLVKPCADESDQCCRYSIEPAVTAGGGPAVVGDRQAVR